MIPLPVDREALDEATGRRDPHAPLCPQCQVEMRLRGGCFGSHYECPRCGWPTRILRQY